MVTIGTRSTRKPGSRIPRTILLASPRGFCAGVRLATEILEAAVQKVAPPVYCLREIVHNRQVVESFRSRGVVFVGSLDQIPKGATVVFSAHGVAPSAIAEAKHRGLTSINATCPFVRRIHSEVKRRAASGFSVIMIGHRAHEEVTGVVGEAPDSVLVVESREEALALRVPDESRIAVVTQTTLSHVETGEIMDVLKKRFPRMESQRADSVCYATLNRQQAALGLASRCALILVLGSRNSSNTNRLAEVVRGAGAKAELISEIEDMDNIEPGASGDIGITAGASTPDSFVSEAVAWLMKRGFGRVEELSVAEEHIKFVLPRNLRP
jgi:4-hydroxy-3-methylbut-2-enyl diphosphate reductase